MMGKDNKQLSTAPAVEHTPIGPQFLIGTIQPVTTQETLEWLAKLPIQPKRTLAQKPCNHGLFDEVARNQME